MRTPESNLQQRGQRLVDILNTGKDFVEEMLRENERLHRNIVLLEGAASSHDGEMVRLKEQAQSHDDERKRTARHVQRLEEENREFAGRSVEMERQNSNLANLYVTSHQLHSTLDFREVLQIVQEIVINLIGSECFAILLVDEQSGALRTIAAEGSSLLPGIPELAVRSGEGLLGRVASSGESYFGEPSNGKAAAIDDPLAVVPLKIKEKVIGLLVIYQLLQQKRTFSATDYELFSMLAGQAATAIFSAKLYTDAERKLSTIQGFLESLTTT